MMLRVVRISLEAALIVGLPLLALLLSTPPSASEISAIRPSWPQCSPCSQLVIARFAGSDTKTPTAYVTVTDAAIVQKFQTLLDAVPVEGGSYKNAPDESELLTVILKNDSGDAGAVEFYGDYIKTPTANLLPNSDPAVKAVQEFALAQLSPAEKAAN